MRLKLKNESGAVPTHGNAHFHARALRAIGQDVGNLYPLSLEISREGVNFRVDGRHLPRDPAPGGAHANSAFLDNLRIKILRGPSPAPTAESPTAPISFNRTYTPADIDRLDDSGAHHRSGMDKVPDIYSLGEMLRMVGRLVDSDGGRLLKLSRDMSGVAFEYEDGSGQKQRRQFSSLQLYKLQQEYHAQRGTHVAIDQWDRAY